MVDEKYFDDGSIYRDVGRAEGVHKAPGDQPQGGLVAEPREISAMQEGAQHGLQRWQATAPARTARLRWSRGRNKEGISWPVSVLTLRSLLMSLLCPNSKDPECKGLIV